jgi:hypothetical protein
VNKIIAGWRQYNVPTISLPFAPAGKRGFTIFISPPLISFPQKNSHPLVFLPAHDTFMSEDENEK